MDIKLVLHLSYDMSVMLTNDVRIEQSAEKSLVKFSDFALTLASLETKPEMKAIAISISIFEICLKIPKDNSTAKVPLPVGIFDEKLPTAISRVNPAEVEEMRSRPIGLIKVDLERALRISATNDKSEVTTFWTIRFARQPQTREPRDVVCNQNPGSPSEHAVDLCGLSQQRAVKTKLRHQHELGDGVKCLVGRVTIELDQFRLVIFRSST